MPRDDFHFILMRECWKDSLRMRDQVSDLGFEAEDYPVPEVALQLYQFRVMSSGGDGAPDAPEGRGVH